LEAIKEITDNHNNMKFNILIVSGIIAEVNNLQFARNNGITKRRQASERLV